MYIEVDTHAVELCTNATSIWGWIISGNELQYIIVSLNSSFPLTYHEFLKVSVPSSYKLTITSHFCWILTHYSNQTHLLSRYDLFSLWPFWPVMSTFFKNKDSVPKLELIGSFLPGRKSHSNTEVRLWRMRLWGRNVTRMMHDNFSVFYLVDFYTVIASL